MPEPLNKVVEAGWADALEPVADQITRMGAFLRAEIAAGSGTFPPERTCCGPSPSLLTTCGC